jgi:hypothetical protein
MVSRIASDREGGFVAIDPVRAGCSVALMPISPPMKVKADRRARRAGLHAVLVLDVWLLALELLGLVVFRACA